MSMSKRWCLTINLSLEFTEDRTEELRSFLSTIISQNEDHISYSVLGLERGSETGRWHVQGYLEFSTRKRMKSVKTILKNDQVHLEVAKGTAAQNRTYCTKEGRILLETGEPAQTNQGKRSDLDDVVEAIKSNASIQQLWEQHTKTMIRCHQGIVIAHQKLQAPQEHQIPDAYVEDQVLNQSIATAVDQVKSVILWGVPGTGKTTTSLKLFPRALLVTHMDDLLQFDPSVHTALIFDDMDFKHFPRTAQIHLLDRFFQRSIHCRYRAATIPPKVVKIFTTNEHAGQIFDFSDAAIARRATVIQFTNKPFI